MLTVQALMTTTVQGVGPETTLRHAAELFARCEISCPPDWIAETHMVIRAQDVVGYSGETGDAAMHALLTAFEQAIEAPTAAAISTLADATRAFGSMQSRRGVPPERAVIELKDVLSAHHGNGWTPSLHTAHEEQFAESRIYARLFPWFVSAYFSEMLAKDS